jgi:RNA polymerase sigma factor for flagellar operon FliA
MKQSTCATPEAPENTLNDAERELLILEHLMQVKVIANRISSRIPSSVELADLVSVGILGLIDAVKKFNPKHGVRFKTFAEHRIRGAILDSLRDLDWAPRGLRSESRKIQTVCGDLEQHLGRVSTEEEKCEALGISLDEYRELAEKMLRMTVDSLDTVADTNEQKHPSPSGSIPDSPNGRPHSIFEKSETRDVMAAAIDNLPKRERLIVSLYYYEELTMYDIGKILGVNESRISQVHASAIRRLKSRLSSLNAVA